MKYARVIIIIYLLQAIIAVAINWSPIRKRVITGVSIDVYKGFAPYVNYIPIIGFISIFTPDVCYAVIEKDGRTICQPLDISSDIENYDVEISNNTQTLLEGGIPRAIYTNGAWVINKTYFNF
jgi:hypothetical protein